MELREFAERIVFGTTLEEKLGAPGPITDENPGRRPAGIALPGRPEGLELNQAGSAAAAPGIAQIHNPRDRGILLHFLANHELLATELMALVLLKFPGAPPAFRQGILATLREEQAHTRLYLQRMQDCGVSFGEFPLSGYFWRMVEPMRSPLEFVSRLSLTFEQANLDYSKYYAKAFAEAGDRETASILQAIYEDEIGHVEHGLTWFRRWKDSRQTDWEAFREALPFPLSPVRAKANEGPFNRAGRLAAGLDEPFIDALELCRQSRGRMPVVRWFDPAAEMSLLATPPDARSRGMLERTATDLESLIFPLAAEDDVVLLRCPPAPAFLRTLVAAGLPVPETLPLPSRDPLAKHPLLARKLERLAPWAWTPDSLTMARAFEAASHRPLPAWSAERRALFTKAWSATQLRTWLTEAPAPPEDVADPSCCGLVIEHLDELDAARHRLATAGWKTALFKVDLGAAGRGQRRLETEGPLPAKDREILTAAMQGQTAAVVEPRLDRVLDISLQWERDADGLRFLGWTRQLIQPGRRYAGAVIGKAFEDLDPPLKRFIVEDRFARLRALEAWLRPRLDTALAAADYTGPVGIDALVAQREDGSFLIKPMVELNPRCTMGQVALRLEKHIARGCTARLLLRSKKQIQDGGHASFAAYASAMERAHPPQRHPQFGLQSGFIPLADPSRAQQLLPVLAVGAKSIHDA